MRSFNLSTLVKSDYNKRAIDIALKFIADQDAFFMTIDSYSGNGDGMTHLMMSLAGELHRTGMKVVNYSAERLLREAAADASQLDRLADSDCLLLDDINFLFDKCTSVSESIFEMLGTRNITGKKTICTLAIAANDIENTIPQSYLCLLYSGTVCRLRAPTFADKFRIAMAKIDHLGIPFNASFNDIIEQAGNIRELEGKLTQYAALQSIQRKAQTGAKSSYD
ncbi:DnaA ATPase domain-containing protein [Alishewanella jeotgali]|uniref:Chromosome replication initiator DnaA n=1 Tax=Alishewanella jeotgali KCTC 22429 TaxID=1129374 RepID=H3Z9R0_9ALTE|nr:DnaA/Hda family protein [Alishewanella jeotgali]EHR42584.1 chromosome replication initiator DnaA [Alishewanella jeotgali KCTC 22429]